MDLPSSNIGVFQNNSAILPLYLSKDGPVTIRRSGKDLRDFLTGEQESMVLTLRQYVAGMYDARASAAEFVETSNEK